MRSVAARGAIKPGRFRACTIVRRDLRSPSAVVINFAIVRGVNTTMVVADAYLTEIAMAPVNVLARVVGFDTLLSASILLFHLLQTILDHHHQHHQYQDHQHLLLPLPLDQHHHHHHHHHYYQLLHLLVFQLCNHHHHNSHHHRHHHHHQYRHQ